MSDNRRSHRVKFDGFVEFITSECHHVCELVDISLQGALIAACSGATPPEGTTCRLVINLDEYKTKQIIIDGSVARKIENRIGIHCESISADSMAHLRKLIEYNLGDVELVNRDFEQLVHEHYIKH